MKRWISLCVWSAVVCSMSLGCGPTESGDAEPGQVADRQVDETTDEQIQTLEHNREHWMVAGAGSRAETVAGSDGHPAQISGRFLNAGAGIDHGSLGNEKWLVGSDSGYVQLLKKSGQRTGERRETFGGTGQLRFLRRGDGSWLAGGTGGEIQRIDRFGQPTSDRYEPFGGDAVTAGRWGSSHWLVGSANGDLVHLEPGSFQTRSSVISFGSGNATIVDILYTNTKWWALTSSAIAEVTSNQVLEPSAIASGRTITTAAFADGTVVVGSEDGHVLAASTGSGLTDASWTAALDGDAVRDFAWNGSEWLAVGDGGRLRRLGVDGAPKGSVTTGVNGHDIDAVRATDNGWMIGVEEASTVTSLDTNLESGVAETDVLGGATVRDVAAGPSAMLAIGDDGKYRLLKPNGAPETDVASVDGVDRLEAARWNGETFLVGGTGGTVVTIDKQGTVDKTVDVLDGTDVVAVSWNRQVWLIVGTDGMVRRLQADGTKFRKPTESGLDTVYAAKYNGSEWMLVGAKGEKGAFVVLDDELSTVAGPTQIEKVDGALRGLGWNGNEWLVGGDGGWVARVDQAGSVIQNRENAGLRAVFSGRTVRAINFNGQNYLVGGDYGIIRRLEFDTLPIRTGVVVNNYRTVHTIAWAHARGFAGGPCISADFCMTGACRGTVTDGFCCESTCDGPCESCFKDETGEPDGQCVAVPKGETPPERKQSNGNGCVKADPETCGQTGKCDGQGGCALYGSETQCQAPKCSSGEQTPAGHCDGKENCVIPDKSECEPYVCGEKACRSSCESDKHCFTGFQCKEGTCEPLGSDDDDEQMGDGDGEDGSGSDGGNGNGGCSAVGGSAPVGSFALFVVLVSCLLLRRRNKRY